MYVYSVDVKKISKNGNNIDLKKFLKKNPNVMYVEKVYMNFQYQAVMLKDI